MEPLDDRDVQLMLAVQRGSIDAFETLFRRYVHAVVRYAYSIVGSWPRAEEIAQEAFLHVYRTRARYRPTARFSTWLYRIVTNLCLSERRRASRREADDAGSEMSMDLLPAGNPGGESDFLARERLARAQRVLQSLPSQQRAALWLARVEGLPYAEVARRLGCSVPAVKSLIHRATNRLRDADQGGESETGG